MRIWLYIIAVLSLMTVGIAAILKYGYQPAPVTVMSPSTFENPEQIGAVLLRQFYGPVAQSRVIAFGIPPQPSWHAMIVRGFLLTAIQEKVPFDVVLSEAQMPPLDISGIEGLQLQSVPMNSVTQAELIDRVHQLRAAGKRVLLFTASVFSSHLLIGNPVLRYEASTGERVFSISTGPLALRSDQEHLIDPPCVGSERDRDGTAPLGCAFLKAGRGYYRKNLKQDKYIAIMNSPRAEDFVLMVSAPGQGGSNGVSGL